MDSSHSFGRHQSEVFNQILSLRLLVCTGPPLHGVKRFSVICCVLQVVDLGAGDHSRGFQTQEHGAEIRTVVGHVLIQQTSCIRTRPCIRSLVLQPGGSVGSSEQDSQR